MTSFYIGAEIATGLVPRAISGYDEQTIRKLGNEKFLANASPDVVEKERAKLEELKNRLA